MSLSRAQRLMALALTVIASLGPLPVDGHPSGTAPIPASGSVVLQPEQPGSVANQLHVFVDQGLGLPASPTDTLTYNWSANGGLGPAVEFTIHDHINNGTTFVDARATNATGAWVITNNITLMVSFTNPTAYPVNVTYQFVLYAPAVVFSPAFFLLPAMAGLAVGWFLWVKAGRPAEEGGIDEADPTDPAADKRKGREEE
jgi:hypothetical protein